MSLKKNSNIIWTFSTYTIVITIGSNNLQDLATGLPNHVYPVFDLYGKCERITILTGTDAGRNGTPIIEEPSALEHDSLNDQDSNVPQCEKADLEVHEKETESQPSSSNVATASIPASASSM